MKRLVQLLAGVAAIAIAVSPAAAQRSDNLEFNGFGSFWRFDRAFLLKNTFGGGVRVGYNLSDRVGLEIVGDYVKTTDVASTFDITVQALSANLVLTYPVGKRSTVYATGGVTHANFGVPYDFSENMVDGGVGGNGGTDEGFVHRAFNLQFLTTTNTKSTKKILRIRAQ